MFYFNDLQIYERSKNGGNRSAYTNLLTSLQGNLKHNFSPLAMGSMQGADLSITDIIERITMIANKHWYIPPSCFVYWYTKWYILLLPCAGMQWTLPKGPINQQHPTDPTSIPCTGCKWNAWTVKISRTSSIGQLHSAYLFITPWTPSH
jgi:hypothetical protein